METLFEILKGFDLQTILSIVIAIWFFNKQTRKDIAELKVQVDSIDKRLIKLEGQFQERGQWEARNSKAQL
jgi:hypothetical protein